MRDPAVPRRHRESHGCRHFRRYRRPVGAHWHASRDRSGASCLAGDSRRQRGGAAAPESRPRHWTSAPPGLSGSLRQDAARETAEAEAKTAGAEVARLCQREADLAAQLGDVQQRLTSEFENIATRVLTARSSRAVGALAKGAGLAARTAARSASRISRPRSRRPIRRKPARCCR